MESSIEAGNLEQVRLPLKDRTDGAKVIGLMQGSEWSETFEPVDNRSVDDGRLTVIGSAVHHAVADCCRQPPA
jgi:hypothetical protein